jgi:superoxide dismutase
MPLDQLVRKVAGDASKTPIFNNAAQAWNHTFFWSSMKAGGGGKPTGRILDRINASFGDFDKFKGAFTDAAKTQFGSGWAWLIEDGGKLAVVKTPNADTPMAQGKKCPAHARRVGARLLPRLPESAARLHHRLPRQARELGVRGQEPGLSAHAGSSSLHLERSRRSMDRAPQLRARSVRSR